MGNEERDTGADMGPFCMASYLARQARSDMTMGRMIRPGHIAGLMFAVLEWRDRPCRCGDCESIRSDILG